MPLYEINCPCCGKRDEVFRAVRDYNDLPECCGLKMVRVLSAPQVMPDIQGYKSMQTGEWIGSRSTHKKHLKQHGLIEVGNEQPKPVVKKKDDSIKRELVRHFYK